MLSGYSRACTLSHKCTAHVWFARVFKLSFSGISLFVLRVKLDVTMPGRCHFNEKWLEKDGYKSWLRKDNKDPNKAFCFACKKSIKLNVMGESALVSHMKGKKHEYVKGLQSNEKTTKISNDGTINWKSSRANNRNIASGHWNWSRKASIA